ncbi:MAG: cellulase family glycosylhydrolase [Rhizobacter sp.]
MTARKFLLMLPALALLTSACGAGENDSPQPVVNSFRSQAAIVVRGQSTLLQWDVKEADHLSIQPGIGVVSGASVSVSPSTTTTYTLVAGRGAVQVSKQVTVDVIENITLPPNSAYFSVDGKPQFITLRNTVGRSMDEYSALFDKARKEGTRIIRVHLSHAPWGMGYDAQGKVDPSWLANWDQLLDQAARAHLYVIPVFSVWADWNDGSNGEAWHVWNLNPMNVANGGTATSPMALFQTGSKTQTLWFTWLGSVVQHWSTRPNMLAWESFSELDLATGASEASSVAFAQSAATVIRQADAAHRPVTTSLGGSWNRWPSLYAGTAVDIVQIHAYGPYADLDATVLSSLPQARAYNKAVLIGESGMDFNAPDGSTLTTQTQGVLGTRNAAWAELVSGAANGRALWWEDGYAIAQNGAPSVGFVMNYAAVEAPVLALTAPLDFTAMQPLAATASTTVLGGVIGNANAAVGWYRSLQCGRNGRFPPDAGPWDCTSAVSNANVTLQLAGSAVRWTAAFYDPATGQPVGMPTTVSASGNRVGLLLPTFAGAIAFKLTPAS